MPVPLSRFLLRLSGIPATDIEELRGHECHYLLKRLAELDGEISTSAIVASDALSSAVKRTADAPARRRLLALRRDLYNRRVPRQADMEVVRAVLCARDAEVIEKAAALIRRRAVVSEELSSAYARELRVTRRRLQALVRHWSLQAGLVLSSESLYDTLPRYTEENPADGLDKAARKVELGLLRYASRAGMKATPFSSLGVVVPGVLVPADVTDPGRGAVEIAGTLERRRSVVRLNKGVYPHLLAHVLHQDAVASRCPVELNPTIVREGDRFVYLAGVRGGESFFRVDANTALGVVKEILGREQCMELRALVDELLASPDIDGAEADVHAFALHLLSIGFLRFRTDIRDQDVDWDERLRELLSRSGDGHAAGVANLLDNLREIADSYASAPPPVRRQLLDAGRARIRVTAERLGIPAAARLTKMLPILEDVTADAEGVLVRDGDIDQILWELAELVALTLPLAAPRAEMATQRAVFDAVYDASVGRVPLLRAYEDLHRAHYRAHLEKEMRLAAAEVADDLRVYDFDNPLGLSLLNDMKNAREHVSAAIAEKWRRNPTAEEIALDSDDLRNATANLPPRSLEAVSACCFGSLLPRSEGRKPRFVCSRETIGAGYGKFFSRFLDLLPEEVTVDLRSAASRLTGAVLAEISGDGNYNPNLHPRLLNWELRYPTTEARRGVNVVDMTDLCIERHPSDPHALRLVHAKTGRTVLPIDLGFAYRRTRPALYQFVQRFMPYIDAQVPLPVTAHESRGRETGGTRGGGAPHSAGAAARDRREVIEYRPRIRYGESIVLARRRWMVPMLAFPQQKNGEGDLAFFLRVNEWRRRNGIPAEVFLRIYEGESWTRKEAAELNRANEDATLERRRRRLRMQRDFDRATLNRAKPQYIDFSSPLFVRLFGRIAAGLDGFVVVIEERYPGGDDLPSYGGKRYAAEVVLQIDFMPAS